MDTVSFSTFRAHLASTLDKVNDDHVPILITRRNGKPVVVMSVEDFKYYEETAYLMASPKNAERLNQAIAEIETCPGVEESGIFDLHKVNLAFQGKIPVDDLTPEELHAHAGMLWQALEELDGSEDSVLREIELAGASAYGVDKQGNLKEAGPK